MLRQEGVHLDITVAGTGCVRTWSGSILSSVTSSKVQVLDLPLVSIAWFDDVMFPWNPVVPENLLTTIVRHTLVSWRGVSRTAGFATVQSVDETYHFNCWRRGKVFESSYCRKRWGFQFHRRLAPIVCLCWFCGATHDYCHLYCGFFSLLWELYSLEEAAGFLGNNGPFAKLYNLRWDLAETLVSNACLLCCDLYWVLLGCSIMFSYPPFYVYVVVFLVADLSCPLFLSSSVSALSGRGFRSI